MLTVSEGTAPGSCGTVCMGWSWEGESRGKGLLSLSGLCYLEQKGKKKTGFCEAGLVLADVVCHPILFSLLGRETVLFLSAISLMSLSLGCTK